MWKHHIKNQHQIRTEGRGEWLKSNERTITKNVFPTFGENFAICNATMKFDWMELIAESEIFDSIEMSEFNIFVPLWIMTQFVDFFLSRSVYLEYHMIGGAHPILMSFSYLLRSKWFKSRFSSFLHFSRFLMIFTWGQHSLFKLYRLFINLSLTLAFHYVDVPILECWNRSNHITWSCRVASCCNVSCREHTQTGGQQFNVVKWNCCEGYAMMKCNQIEFSFLIEFLRSPSSSLLIYSDYSWGKKWRKTSTRNVSRFVHIFSSLVATHSFMQIMSFWFHSTFSNNFIIFPLSYA